MKQVDVYRSRTDINQVSSPALPSQIVGGNHRVQKELTKTIVSQLVYTLDRSIWPSHFFVASECAAYAEDGASQLVYAFLVIRF